LADSREAVHRQNAKALHRLDPLINIALCGGGDHDDNLPSTAGNYEVQSRAVESAVSKTAVNDGISCLIQ
jgi:hypothetical protein